MSLEQVIEKTTQAIEALIAALQAQPLNIPKVEPVAAVAEAPVKESKPKAEPKKKPEPVKVVAPEPEVVPEEVEPEVLLEEVEPEIEDIDLDDLDDLDDVIEGELSEEIPQLPAGERTPAYYIANVQPTLQALGKVNVPGLRDLIRVQYGAEKGNLIPSDKWDELVYKANALLNDVA